MAQSALGVYPLTYEEATDRSYLESIIYPDMRRNYYWSDDFSPDFYIAQAKAGFIAVTDIYEGKELLLPEIQFSYALLDFANLHISRKVKSLLKKASPKLILTSNIAPIAQKIRHYHPHCWLTPRYETMLMQTHGLDPSFQVVGAYIEAEDGSMVAGEIGYAIGHTYTSLSGFSSRQKAYRNYGTAQLVLLGEYLAAKGFAFWNLGQSYMPYKFDLGAINHTRDAFLKRWYTHINKRSLLP